MAFSVTQTASVFMVCLDPLLCFHLRSSGWYGTGCNLGSLAVGKSRSVSNRSQPYLEVAAPQMVMLDSQMIVLAISGTEEKYLSDSFFTFLRWAGDLCDHRLSLLVQSPYLINF
jgi:hypothetical protein